MGPGTGDIDLCLDLLEVRARTDGDVARAVSILRDVRLMVVYTTALLARIAEDCDEAASRLADGNAEGLADALTYTAVAARSVARV